jgi:hypothetical protein
MGLRQLQKCDSQKEECLCRTVRESDQNEGCLCRKVRDSHLEEGRVVTRQLLDKLPLQDWLECACGPAKARDKQTAGRVSVGFRMQG